MQFTDGNRLDLHVCTLNQVSSEINNDKLNRILLNKDNCLPKIPETTDENYWVKRPSEKQFLDICNEFCWCLNNVA
jgi:aminoglycoside 6-adenylyltransferase